jgi:hypothetical protein
LTLKPRTESKQTTLLQSFQEELIRACYRALLRREAESSILDGLTAPALPESQRVAIRDTLEKFLASEEWKVRFEARRRQQRRVDAPNPYDRFSNMVIFFIHMEKTAGTTIADSISESFADKKQVLYQSDIFIHCLDEIMECKFISGHYDYNDSLLLPQKNVTRISFFRDPYKRLASHYRYALSFDPKIQWDDPTIALAHELSISDYFSCKEVLNDVRFDNLYLHVFGHSRYGPPLPKGEARRKAFDIASDRISKLDVVGLTERIEESARMVGKVTGISLPDTIESRNVSDKFGTIESKNRYFEENELNRTEGHLRYVPPIELTDETRELMSDLVGYDLKLYEQAKKTFELRLSALNA